MKKRDSLKDTLISSGKTTKGEKRKHTKDFYLIDSFCHFTTFEYISLLEKLSGIYPNPFRRPAAPNPSMYDVDARLKMMDDCGINLSILLPLPNIETVPPVYDNPALAIQAAKLINDTIAEIVVHHPKRFLGVALLPTTNADIMLTELERAVTQLHAVGGYFIASPTSKPPDHPDYMQLYGKAVELNVPLWMHPSRPMNFPDYTLDTPPVSKYFLPVILGWIEDSSIAMARIVLKGVFDTYPGLKIITHHRGAMIPLLANRLQEQFDFAEEMGLPMDTTISKPYIEHFKKFYCDTTCYLDSETELVKVAYDFFGPDHVLFGTDAPYSTNYGRNGTLASRYNVEKLKVTNKALKKIFSENILNIIPHQPNI
jgi:predicted TIM-barrel fold metal-dependent hydrolase